MKTVQSLIAEMYFGTNFDNTALDLEANADAVTFSWGNDEYLSIIEKKDHTPEVVDNETQVLRSERAYELIDGIKLLESNEAKDLFKQLPNILERSYFTLSVIESSSNEDYDEFVVVGKYSEGVEHTFVIRLSKTLDINNAIKVANLKDRFYEEIKADFGLEIHDVLSGIFIDFINGLDKSVFTSSSNITKSTTAKSITYTCKSDYDTTGITVTLGEWSEGIGFSIKALERLNIPEYLYHLCRSLHFIYTAIERNKAIFRIEEQDSTNKHLKIILRDIGTIEITLP